MSRSGLSAGSGSRLHAAARVVVSGVLLTLITAFPVAVIVMLIALPRRRPRERESVPPL